MTVQQVAKLPQCCYLCAHLCCTWGPRASRLTCMHWKTCSATPGASTSIRLGLKRTSGAIMRSPPTRIVRPSGRVYDCTRQVVSLASCKAHESSESQSSSHPCMQPRSQSQKHSMMYAYLRCMDQAM